MTEQEQRALVLGVVASLLAVLTIRAFSRKTYSPSQLVRPEVAASLAASLPYGEDDFILSALEWVNRNIEYRPISTDIVFQDGKVACRDCLLPTDTLRTRRANCVGSSLLLTSILRNRLPPDRVYSAFGEVNTDSVGGHAWNLVLRTGDWYLLDPTNRAMLGKWIKADHPIYTGEVYLNDKGFYCEPGTSVRICAGRSACFGGLDKPALFVYD